MKIIVTGCAGFIGSYVAEQLLKRGDEVLGIDNINNYYDINIKIQNLVLLKKYPNFIFYCENVMNTTKISEWKPEKICHMASMAGVRFSIEKPCLYVKENIEVFTFLLEEAVKNNINNIVYASSSSVYGLNESVPFKESDPIEKCNSPYACSKRCMELMAQTYNQLYDISVIGLRFFTVYGPRGRPDMAPYKFLKAILNEDEFTKYGDGSSSRDYTYIDDIVDGIISALDNKNNIKCDVFNLGNSSPVSLNDFIKTCEDVTGKKAKYKLLPEQLGDVPHTYADITKAKRLLDYNPKVSLKYGLEKTTEYLKLIDENYYKINSVKYCYLGDCFKQECHHCFPVKNCSVGHILCKENGCCDEIFNS